MPEATNNHQNPSAQKRLLAAGETLFAGQGYAQTSVRQVTETAECNIAAVNYHFGGKDKLYRAVYQQVLDRLRAQRLHGIAQLQSLTPEELTLEKVLRGFTITFLEPLVDETQGRQMMQLFMREMLDPQLPPEMFLTELIVPVLKALQEIMARVCPQLAPQTLTMCLQSLVGQLLRVVHTHSHPAAPGHKAFLPSDLSAMTEHIVRFTAAGIRSYMHEESA